MNYNNECDECLNCNECDEDCIDESENWNDGKDKAIRMRCCKCDHEFEEIYFVDGHTDDDPTVCPNCGNNDDSEFAMYLGE